jgi:hypothetical protein
MSVTEPITIPVEGDPRDFIADAKKVQEQMDIMAHRLEKAGVSQAAYNKAVTNSRGAMDGQVASVKKASISITDLRSAYMIVADVARVAGQVWQATGQEFVNYAEQVKNMSRAIGASAEETSRIIQVADDVRISYDSLKIAMKEAQKDGIEPNIEGLAKLADKYVALSSPIAKQKLLLDTFGKSGLEMGKLMEKGGDGIRSMSGAISDNLIMTDKGIKASDDYQRSLDDLTDAAKGVQVEIGSMVVPAMNSFMRVVLADIQGVSVLRDVLTGDKSLVEAAKEWADIVNDNSFEIFGLQVGKARGAVEELPPALEETGQSFDAQTAAVKAADDALNNYRDALDAVSQANQDAESFIQNYADSQQDYAESHAEAVSNMAKAQSELSDAMKDGDSKDVDAAKDGLLEAGKAIQDLEATWHESTQKMQYDMMLAKVSVDGLTDAEFKATQDKAVQMGIRTQADADQAKSMMDMATAAADGIAMQEDVMREKAQTDADLLALETAKAQAADTTTQTVVQGAALEVNALGQVTGAIDASTRSLIAMGYAASKTAGATAGIRFGGTTSIANSGYAVKTGGKSPDERDSGGVGIAGTPYLIGKGAQPEMFVPSTNGTFIPNANKIGGAVYNIVINNPVPEKSDNSVRSALKNLSYAGAV